MLYGFSQEIPYGVKANADEYLNSEYFRNLKSKFIRFPAGFLSHFYKFSKDGYDVKDLDKYSKYKEQWLVDYFAYFDGKRNKVGLNSIVDYSLKNNSDIVFNLNVLTEDSDDIIRVLKEAENKGVQIKYCEIGNEVYHQYTRGTVTIDEYINKALPLVNKLKLNFPKVKIAIPIGGDSRWEIIKPWDLALAKARLPVDAVVYHPYATFKKEYNSYLASAIYMQFIKNKLDSAEKYITTLFPGKEIWVTEWNIEDNSENTICKSQFGTLFMCDMSFYFLRSKFIKIASFHRILSKQYALLDIDYNSKPLQVRKSISYYFFENFGDVISKSFDSGFPNKDSIKNNLDESIDVQCFRGKNFQAFIVLNRGSNFKKVEFYRGNKVLSGQITILNSFSSEKPQSISKPKPEILSFPTLLPGHSVSFIIIN